MILIPDNLCWRSPPSHSPKLEVLAAYRTFCLQLSTCKQPLIYLAASHGKRRRKTMQIHFLNTAHHTATDSKWWVGPLGGWVGPACQHLFRQISRHFTKALRWRSCFVVLWLTRAAPAEVFFRPFTAHCYPVFDCFYWKFNELTWPSSRALSSTYSIRRATRKFYFNFECGVQRRGLPPRPPAWSSSPRQIWRYRTKVAGTLPRRRLGFRGCLWAQPVSLFAISKLMRYVLRWLPFPQLIIHSPATNCRAGRWVWPVFTYINSSAAPEASALIAVAQAVSFLSPGRGLPLCSAVIFPLLALQ